MLFKAFDSFQKPYLFMYKTLIYINLLHSPLNTFNKSARNVFYLLSAFFIKQNAQGSL